MKFWVYPLAPVQFMRITMGTLKDISRESLSCGTREKTNDWWLAKVDLIDDEHAESYEGNNQGRQDAG